jgi:PPM family protein phosphatase
VDELISIGEFSQQSGLSLKRLRTYAASGLLVPAAIDAGSGYRYYAPGQLREAQLIDALRQSGMSLIDVGGLLRHPSNERLDAWEHAIHGDAAKRRAALQRARQLLPAALESPASPDRQYRGGRPMTQLSTGCRTEKGPVRHRNEDAVVGREHLVAVCDGMGGHPGGEIASAIAISLVDAAFTGRSADELHAGVRAANRAIRDRAGAESDLEGMGTTVCAAGLLPEGHLVLVHVGDTRAYLLHGGSVTQLTRDHTVTADLVERGELSEDDARLHPHRAVLTRALGVGPEVELDDATVSLQPDDRLLVCTDGLFNEVALEEIADALAGRRDPQRTADELVDRALARGGHDNVSVVVADLVG